MLNGLEGSTIELAIRRRRRRRRIGTWLGVLAVVLAGLGGAAWWLLGRPGPVQDRPAAPIPTLPPTTARPTVPPEPPAPAPKETPPETAQPLPPLAESDGLVRSLAGGLSPHASLADWLSKGGNIERFVAAVDAVASGETPRPLLLFLAPGGSFRVVERDGQVFLDPKSYERWDGVAEVVATIDAPRAVEVYRTLRPLCETAYRDLGHPDGRFDDAVAHALRVLLATPNLEGDVELAPRVVTYAFADPKLEGLSPVQKQLLRMGPRNVRLVQTELRALAAALGMPPG
jgi:hypothetical protein